MDWISVLLIAVVVGIAVLVPGGLLAERITALVRRFVPGFWYDGQGFLLWGLMLWTAFVLGLMVMYLVLKP
jgi:uncharacterized membrane protein YjjB (DUF3815 family)